MAVRQQQRRGTASQWTSADPILSAAEIGYETDTNKFKIGDGTNRWSTLSYFVDLDTMIAGAPGLLNSLDEIAAAINDDPAFFTTIASSMSSKAPIASPTFTGTVSGVTKSMVGLGSVDNTADTAKPVSTAQATAIATAKSEAISTASTDATVKAATAKSEAIAEAAIDASMKRNAAKAYADGLIETEVINRNSAITTAVGNVVNAAPEALNTLKELADALTADESTAATLATLVGTKASSAQVATDIAAEATARNTAIAAEATARNTAIASHESDTTNIHGIANTALLVTQSDLSSALAGATVDQSALAGVGIDWNPTTEAFDIDSTVATKTYVDAAQDAAELDATSKVQAESLARASAITAALVTAAADATSKVATEESNRNTSIASAIANEVTNRNSAISTGKLVVQGLAEADATSKANAAQAAAIAAAATDATAKANSAITTATATASADATTKADAAKAFATAADTTLRTAITTDIATAKSEAITAATNAVNAVVASAPAALDTLDELAAALGDDANYAATITTALSAKAPLASPALTGNPTAPTQTLGNDSTRVATTAFVKAAIQDISSLNLVLDGGGVE
jgi:hypothetical protein